jgi:hypothetical protein
MNIVQVSRHHIVGMPEATTNDGIYKVLIAVTAKQFVLSDHRAWYPIV